MFEKKIEKRPAAFFDLDLTITDRDSFRYFLQKHYLHNPHNWRFVPHVLIWAILRKLRIVSLQAFKEKSLVSLKGEQNSFIRRVGLAFFEKNLINILREKAVNKIEWHRERGDFVFIVSSCPDLYLSNLTEYLRCDGYECTKLALCRRQIYWKF